MDSIEKKEHFWNKKISLWHFIYFAIICLGFIVGTLVILPGRINNDAFQNFSFASTVTSIVLAVVSIVYSLQSGLKSLGQMNSIQNIEQRISSEISKFSGIDEKIRRAIDPISTQVGEVKKKQDNLLQAQDSLHEEMFNMANIQVGSGDKETNINGPKILTMVLYAAAKSKESGKDIPYHILGRYVGGQAKYCEGLLDGFAAISSSKIKVSTGLKSTRKKVETFDTDTFGSAEELKKKAINSTGIKNKEIIDKIDNYFCTACNQHPNEDFVD
jgi:hypothetical protein